MDMKKQLDEFIKKTPYEEIRKIARPNPIDWTAPTAVYSTRVALWMLKLGITPNQITVFWTLAVSLITFLLWFGSYKLNILFVFLYIFLYGFDYIDGDMARIMKRAVPKFNQNILGSWIDKIYYYFHRALVIIGLSIGVASSSGNVRYFYLGVVTIFFVFGDIMIKLREIDVLVSKNKYAPPKYKPAKDGMDGLLKRYLIPLCRPDPVSLLTLALLINMANVMVILYFMLFAYSFSTSYYKIFMRLRRLYRN